MLQTEEYYQDYENRVCLIGAILEELGDMAMHNEKYDEYQSQLLAIFEHLEADPFDVYDLHLFLHTARFNELLTHFKLNPNPDNYR